MAGARQQPQGTARLVRGNPLAITDIWIGSSALTLVKGYVAQATSINSGITGAGPGGRFVRGDGVSVSSGYQISDNSNNLLGSVGTTWAIVRRCRDTVVRPIYMHYGYDLGANNRCLLGAPEEGNITWDFGNATTGSGRLQAPYVKDTLMETLVVVAGQVKGREIWRRGVKLAGNPAAKALRNMDAAPFGIGRVNGNTASDDVETYMVIVSNKEWSDAEIKAWSANPWSVVDAPSMRMAFPAVAALSATANWTEGSESTNAVASLRVNASLNWAEASEVSSTAASTRTNLAPGWVEGSDVVAVGTSALMTAAAAWSEGAEGYASSLAVRVTAAATWAESAEMGALQATVGNAVTANVSWVEAVEGVISAASSKVNAAASWAESPEVATVQSVIGNAAIATANWAEAREAVSSAISAKGNLALGWMEARDGFSLDANNGDSQRDIDASLVPSRQTVVFEGSRRVVAFEGGKRVVSFEGSKRMVEFQ